MRFIHRSGIGTTLIQLVDEHKHLLSRLEILKMKIWFSGIQIPVCGIAGVYTPPNFRHRGYARKCLEYALRLQQEDKQCLSFLFGTPNFYEKFGYVLVMPWYGVYVYHRLWPILPHEPRIYDYSPSDEEAILRLYRQNVRFQVGPLVRDPQNPIKPFFPTAWRNGGIIRTLKDRQKNLTGYVWHSEANAKEFEIVEVGAVDRTSLDLVLAYLLNESKRRLKNYFIAALPPDDPFSMYLKRFETKYVVQWKQSSGGMATILNLKDIIKRLEPVFCQRVRLIRSDLIPKVLTISTEKESVSLHIGGTGTESEIKISLKMLTQLLFGHMSLDESVRSGEKNLPKPEICEVLFPRLHAFTYLKDRY